MFKDIKEKALEKLTPNIIANYVYDIMKLFASYYHEFSVLKQDKNKCYSYTYLIITDKSIDEMIMQEDEVSELKYITLKELENKIEIQDEKLPLVKRSYIKELVGKIKEEANKI